MLRIEIKSDKVTEKSGVSNNTGKPYKMFNQTGFAIIDENDYPVKIQFLLEEGQSGYPVGMYELSSDSFYVAQFGRLTLGNLKLVKIK